MADEKKVQIPVALNSNYLAFEKFFKMLMEDIIRGQGNVRIGNLPSRAKIDAELRRSLIKGFHGVNLDEDQNTIALTEMINAIWKKIDPVIRQEVRHYGSKFRKTIL